MPETWMIWFVLMNDLCFQEDVCSILCVLTFRRMYFPIHGAQLAQHPNIRTTKIWNWTLSIFPKLWDPATLNTVSACIYKHTVTFSQSYKYVNMIRDIYYYTIPPNCHRLRKKGSNTSVYVQLICVCILIYIYIYVYTYIHITHVYKKHMFLYMIWFNIILYIHIHLNLANPGRGVTSASAGAVRSSGVGGGVGPRFKPKSVTSKTTSPWRWRYSGFIYLCLFISLVVYLTIYWCTYWFIYWSI